MRNELVGELHMPLEMKRNHWQIAFAMLAILGCAPNRSLWIHVQLPASLAKDSRRFRAFQSRASHLSVHLETKAGHSWDGTFPPSAWENLVAPALPFPEGKGDRFEVAVELWDLTSDGHPRAFAALAGKRSMGPDQVKQSGPHDFPLRLTLQVNPKEYD